jgi:hypothetical protein
MINFSEVETSVRELKRQLIAGHIDEKSFEERLLKMIDTAGDGYYWMFGHKSEQWFRHDGQKWLQDDPNKITARHAQSKNISNTHSATKQDTEENLPVNWGWLVISLGIIGAVGWIIYASVAV